jgi:hypothetical protein
LNNNAANNKLIKILNDFSSQIKENRAFLASITEFGNKIDVAFIAVVKEITPNF